MVFPGFPESSVYSVVCVESPSASTVSVRTKGSRKIAYPSAASSAMIIAALPIITRRLFICFPFPLRAYLKRKSAEMESQRIFRYTLKR